MTCAMSHDTDADTATANDADCAVRSHGHDR